MSKCDSCVHYHYNAMGSGLCGADLMHKDFSCYEGLPVNVEPLGCKAYSIKELDDLRVAVKHRVAFGSSYHPPGWEIPIGTDLNRPDFVKRVETEISTYMLAGIVAADLIAADEEYSRKFKE
jgi:hypothetical protein